MHNVRVGPFPTRVISRRFPASSATNYIATSVNMVPSAELNNPSSSFIVEEMGQGAKFLIEEFFL
ncbi:hypothetical protein J6590_004111, partial [Homalodisca vitripennis]